MIGLGIWIMISVYPFNPEIINLQYSNTDTIYYMSSTTVSLWNSIASIDFLSKKLGRVFNRRDYLTLLKKSKGQNITLQGDVDAVLLRVLWGGYVGQIGVRGFGAGLLPNKFLSLLAEGNTFNERFNFKNTEGIALLYSYITFGISSDFLYRSFSGNVLISVGPILLSRLFRIDTLQGYFVTTPEGFTTRIHSVAVSGEDGIGLTLRTSGNIKISRYIGLQAFASIGVLRWSDVTTLNIDIYADSAFMRNINRERYEDEAISYSLTLPIEFLVRGYISGKIVDIAPWVYYRKHAKLKSLRKFEYGLDFLTHIMFRIGIYSSLSMSSEQGLSLSLGISKAIGPLNLHLKVGSIGGIGVNSRGVSTEVFIGYKSSLI